MQVYFLQIRQLYASLEAFTTLWLRTPVFWDVAPNQWVIRSRRRKGMYCTAFILRGSEVREGP